MKTAKQNDYRKALEEVVSIAGMTAQILTPLVNIAGMSSAFRGGQHHRNDPDAITYEVVNIIRIL